MKTAKFSKENAPKIATQVAAKVNEWTAKGCTPKQILNHLYTYNGISGTFQNGCYTLVIGLKMYNGWDYTFSI